MQLGHSAGVADSTNWSGLAETGSGIEGAEGEWTVPTIEPSASALYSASWVGVDGWGNNDLIQTGTEQDTSDGYYAWMEILPAAQVIITTSSGSPARVEPGDQITASVAEASPGVWTIYLQDTTQDWYFEQNFDYDGPGDSAEWIEEAPTVDGEQSTPADFGTIDFSGTGMYGNFGSGTGWYSTDMTTSNEIAMCNAACTQILAMPSAPSASSSDGQSFSDTYVTAPGTPTRLAASVGVSSVNLAWQAPASDGGTALVGYDVAESLAGVLQKTIYVPDATSTTIDDLITNDSYSFSVAAVSAGNWTSPYSAPVTAAPTKPPSVLFVGSPQGFQLSRELDVRYSATDPPSPVISYDVRYDVAPWKSKYASNYVYPAAWQGTTSTSSEMTGTPGDEYCFDVRTVMQSGDSPWSSDDCTTLPLSSASLKPVTSGWSRHTGAGYYEHSYLETTSEGAELRLAGAEVGQVAPVVTECPSCGRLAVYVNGRLLRTVSTHARTTRHGVVIVLPWVSLRRATIVLESVSKGKLIIEGLGIA